MFDDINDLYQQVILDHCKQPRNFHELAAATCSAHGRNPICGDQLKLFLALDGDTIRDISFTGSGCCISKASASLLTENLKGKTRADVVASEALRVMIWPHQEIENWVAGDAKRLMIFQAALGTQVVEQLLRRKDAA